MDAPLGALFAKLNLALSKELAVVPTVKVNLFPSSIDKFPRGFISSTCSVASVGVLELSLDALPTPIPFIAETL